MKLLPWIGGCLLVASSLNAGIELDKARKPPFEVSDMEEPRFPPALLMRGVTKGEADVVFSIDEEGNPLDCLVEGYSEPEFARAAVAAIKHSHFGPIRINGHPAAIRPILHFNFEATGVVLSLTPAENVTTRMDSMTGLHRTSNLGTLSDLDASPKAIHTVSPRYPASLAADKVAGKVVLDFYIDQQGKVRMPALEQTDHPDLVDPASQALLEWQFEPPTRNGKPVIVHSRQVFVFDPKS